MVMSAVSSVSTFGVLVTVMPRACAAVDVDIVDAVAEIRDQLQLAVGLLEQISAVISSVTVGTSTSAVRTASAICAGVHRRIVEIEPGVEQFAHARLDRVRQFTGDDDERLFLNRHVLLS